MISIHLDDFVTNCLVFAFCWWLVANGITSVIRVRLFWLERELIRKQKPTRPQRQGEK